MEGFLMRGWELVLPGCGRTSTLARGTTLEARWLHVAQPFSNHPQWDWDFHTPRGGFDPGDHRDRSQVVGVAKV